MKTIITVFWFITAGVVCGASLSRPTNDWSANPFAGPSGTLLGVTKGEDLRTLVIRYEFMERTNQQSLTLPRHIADYHFCSWVRDRGVAFALSDSRGDIYWATAFFARLTKPIYPRAISSPQGYKLMGIANMGGDTIAIAAIDVHRDQEFVARGWIYINSCPPAWDVFVRVPTNAPTNSIQMSGFDHLAYFEIPRKGAAAKQ